MAKSAREFTKGQLVELERAAGWERAEVIRIYRNRVRIRVVATGEEILAEPWWLRSTT